MTTPYLVCPPLHPPMEIDESMSGYVMRLAELNKYPNTTWLSSDGSSFQFSKPDALRQTLLNTQWCNPNIDNPAIKSFYANTPDKDIMTKKMRYCVLCIRETPYLRIHWQDRYYLTCLKHHCWMIDTCHQCGKNLNMHVDGIIHCSCSADIADAAPESVHEQVSRLTAFAIGLASDTQPNNFPSQIYSLCAVRRRKLIRFFMKWFRVSHASKVKAMHASNDAINAKHEFMAAANIILGNLDALDSLLQVITTLTLVSKNKQWKKLVASRFSLEFERNFDEPFFQEIKDFIHSYLLLQTPLRIDGRVKVFSAEEVSQRRWLSRGEARARAGLSKDRFRWLMATGQINTYPLGNGFTDNYLVSYPDIERQLHRLQSDMLFIQDAAQVLGVRLPLVRLLEGKDLLGVPEVLSHKRKSSVYYQRQKVSELKLLFSQPRISQSEDLISVGELMDLHYGYDNQFLTHLVRAIVSTDISLRREATNNSILSASISFEEFENWFRFIYSDNPLSIETLSRNIQISKQVLVKMHRDGLLRICVSNKHEPYITHEELTAFNRQFVFGKRMTDETHILISELSRDLEAKNIFSIDETATFTMPCKIYRRIDVIPLLDFSSTLAEKRAWLKQRASFHTWLPHSLRARQASLFHSQFRCRECGSQT